MSKICIYFGSSTGFTEMAAETLCSQISPKEFEVFNAVDDPLSVINQFDLIFLGISTWDYGGLQEDWQERLSEIESLNMTGKFVALFGMGDQLGYSAWFQDAMGKVHNELLSVNATPLGYWPTEGYEFTHSAAVSLDPDFFVGLALDDTNQPELTKQRLEQWSRQVFEEFEQPKINHTC